MDTSFMQSKPELWGGMECTINRVGNKYRDQFSELGHYTRGESDIQLLEGLNIKALRYPLLWERYLPQRETKIDWSPAIRDMCALDKLGIKPVVGLLHHGSGPTYTHLLDDQFPEKFSEYAEKVATQFPSIEYVVPINEPLTTARFCGLYGHWYPHHHSDRSFAKILVNQLKATVFAVRAMRRLNPKIKFIQTEDICKVHSTPMLAYQAEFENIRRWLPFDFLFGTVNKSHPLWNYFIDAGITESDLYFFQNNRCPPDIIGAHYYVTSERFLDERIEFYPHVRAGTNGIHKYVDVESVRTSCGINLEARIKEVWNRYSTPIAITEAHLASTREEQMRWFRDVWDTSCKLQTEGIPLEAVTAWALFGAFDWNTLVTKQNGYYESGAYSVNRTVRPTALVKMLSSLGKSGDFKHPLLDNEGWWHRHEERNFNIGKPHTRPLLIIGKHGSLAVAFSKVCNARGIHHISLSKNDIDITNELDVQHVINETDTWGIVNASGYVRVDDAESEFLECYQINTLGSGVLAKACKVSDIPFMTFSSDQVFNGIKNAPYLEYDEVDPINNYGRTKAWAESFVLRSNPCSLVIRSSAFFSPWDRFNFAHRLLDALKNNKHFPVPCDIIISPTYLPHLVNFALDLFIDGEKGVWHLANEGGVLSWLDFAKQLADHAGYNAKRLKSMDRKGMNWKANRPAYSVLRSSRGVSLPSLNDAINDYFRQLKYS